MADPNPYDQQLNEITRQLRFMNTHLRGLKVLAQAARCSEPDVYDLICENLSFQMYLPQAHYDFIQASIVEKSTFYQLAMLQKLRQLVPSGDYDVLDCGANIGNHALFFSYLLTRGTVHAFEALEPTFRILERNIALNERTQISANNRILGSEVARADIKIFNSTNVGATAFDEAADQGAYETVPLDSFGFTNVGLIKIDVEGMQLPVLKGARDLISESRPYVCVEVNPKDDDIHPIMQSLGYGEPVQLGPYDWLYAPAKTA